MAMKDWKQIASAGGLNIPAEDVARISPALDALEAGFRPLAGAIPEDVEPAVTVRAELTMSWAPTRSATRMNSDATWGSNCAPAQRLISSMILSAGRARW